MPPRLCNIPARTLPPCDMVWGHEGDMHGNAGDGFYASDYDVEHHRRQKALAKNSPPAKTAAKPKPKRKAS